MRESVFAAAAAAVVLSRAELCVMCCPPATKHCSKTIMPGALCPAPPLLTTRYCVDVFVSLPTSSWPQALGFLLASDDGALTRRD